LYLDKSTVSRIVEGMQEERLIVRVKDSSDGRSARLHPSAAGGRRYKKLEQDVIREYRRAFARYTPADWTRSIELVRELAAIAMTR
jgi:DNA-binding MarR family transcriptional regulator